MIGFESQEHWNKQYILAVLDRAELQRYLSVTEVDSLTEDDMQEIAQAMQEEINEYGLWEIMASVARRIVAQRKKERARTT